MTACPDDTNYSDYEPLEGWYMRSVNGGPMKRHLFVNAVAICERSADSEPEPGDNVWEPVCTDCRMFNDIRGILG